MESVWSVSKLSTESVGSRRELVANVHTADADATKQFRRVGIGGVYWALLSLLSRLDAAKLLLEQLLLPVVLFRVLSLLLTGGVFSHV